MTFVSNKNTSFKFIAFLLSFLIIFSVNNFKSYAAEEKVYSYSNGVKMDANRYRLIPIGKIISLGPATGVYDHIVKVDWTSDNSNVMKIVGKGDGSTTLVQAVKPGATIVHAYVDSSYQFGYTYDYQTYDNQYKFRVVKPVQKLSFKQSNVTLVVGKTKQLSIKSTPDSNYSRAVSGITYKSSNTKVATVDKNGKVTAKGSGTAVITVYTTDTAKVTAKCTVKVGKPTIKKSGGILKCYANGKLYTANTLVKYNGKLYHVKGGKVVYDTTLVKYDGVYRYVKKGVVNTSNTLVKYNGKYYHVKGGKWVKDTTLVKYNGSWIYVKNGIKNTSNTLVKYNNKWYHVKGGKWVKDTCLVKYGGNLIYVKKGIKNLTETLFKHTDGKMYHVKGGKVVYDTTLVKFSNAKYYVKNGVYTKATTLVQIGNAKYYVKNGKYQANFTGSVKIGGKSYYIKKGKLAVSSITLNRETLTLESGDTYNLTVTGVDSSVKLNWSSNNPNTAIVNIGGGVTAFLPGEAIITVKAIIDGLTFSDTCKVTVTGYSTYRLTPSVPSYPEVANKWGLKYYDSSTDYESDGTVIYEYIYKDAWQDDTYSLKYIKALKGYQFYELYDYSNVDYSRQFTVKYSNPDGSIHIWYSQSFINHKVTIRIFKYN